MHKVTDRCMSRLTFPPACLFWLAQTENKMWKQLRLCNHARYSEILWHFPDTIFFSLLTTQSKWVLKPHQLHKISMLHFLLQPPLIGENMKHVSNRSLTHMPFWKSTSKTHDSRMQHLSTGNISPETELSSVLRVITIPSLLYSFQVFSLHEYWLRTYFRTKKLLHNKTYNY